MLAEQLIFAVIALGLFFYIFYKIFQKNDTSYVIPLILQAVGIVLDFLEVLFSIELNFLFVTLKYIMAIILPAVIIIIERHGTPWIEMMNMAKAKMYLKFGNNRLAKKALIELVTKYPENYQGHRMLAKIYEKEGGMRKAIDEYVQAIDSNKKDYDSYYKVAELLNQLEKSDEAAEMLFNLLNKKPEYSQATTLLGDILIKKEMYKEAASIYQYALKYQPFNYEFNYNLGMVYTMLNDFQNAKLYYEKAAEINSLSYNSKYMLAEIALIYKELEEAEKYFMQVIEEEEIAPDGYYELAKIALIRGEKDTAIKYANTAIDSDSKKIVPKVKKDPIFIPILAKLSIPFNLEEKEDIEGNQNTKHKLGEKERKAKEHLEEMFELTRHLSYNDINLLKRNEKEKAKQEIENQIRQQKEREN